MQQTARYNICEKLHEAQCCWDPGCEKVERQETEVGWAFVRRVKKLGLYCIADAEPVKRSQREGIWSEQQLRG